MPRALATVDLGAVRRNIAGLIGRLSPGCSLMAVVKADAYGHGAVPVARAALDAGAAALGVATAHEAAELREAGIEGRIVILGPLNGDDLDAAFGLDAEVVAWSLPFLKELVLKGQARGSRLRLHVKIDTGMHRLGLSPRELPGYLDALETEPEAEMAGVMTHFATADEGDDFFSYQVRAFEDAAQVVLRTGTRVEFHCANSAATLVSPESHFDMVRCGIAIYGMSPFQGDAAADGLEPALSLTSYIADTRTISAGDTVGYGRTWEARESTVIAVIPIGYGDGVSRLLSSRGRVACGGRFYPIVGRVSMDQITIDLGASPDVTPGQEVHLIGGGDGASVSAEEVASLMGTINYEVTCNISRRVERRFLT